MAADDILLHVCCAPCSTVAVPWWRSEGLEPLALFFNPNVQPPPEYARRLAAMQDFATGAGLHLVVDESATGEAWMRTAGGSWEPTSEALPAAPAASRSESGSAGDTGSRCAACLRLRLAEAAWAAAERGLPRFSTSLTLSPYQRHDLILAAGLRAAEEAGVEFLYADLRRHYRRSIEASRRLALYRQPYCGCAPSKWEAWHEKRGRRRGHGRDAA